MAELFSTIDHIINQLDTKRIAIDKAVEAEKKGRKEKLIVKARDAWKAHIAKLETEIDPIKLSVSMPDFNEAAKNKRTPESLQNAIDTELANGKIAADAQAQVLRANTAYIETVMDHKFLFADLQAIVTKSNDDFKALVTLRIQNHKDAEEAKAKAAETPVVVQLLDAVMDEVIAPAASPTVTATVTPAPAVIQMPVRTAPTPGAVSKLSVGVISMHLGFMVTSAFVESLGFKSERIKGAVLFHATFDEITRAVIGHHNGLLAKAAA